MNININVDLSEFSDNEIIDYIVELIENDSLSIRNKEALSDALKINLEEELQEASVFNMNDLSIIDKLKLEYIERVFDSYTLSELERLLPTK